MTEAAGGSNIRTAIHTTGLESLETKASAISGVLNTASSEDMTQVEFLKLQQQASEYNNIVSLMTNIFKGLYDTDKEVIRNT